TVIAGGFKAVTSRARSTLPSAGRLPRWWLNRPVRMKGLIAIAVPLIALLVTAAASLTLQFREGQARSAGRASFEVIEAANRVFGDALNGETGVRGYAATGSPLFLQPYNQMLGQMDAARAAFRQAAITAGDVPEQQAADAAAGQVVANLAVIRTAVTDRVP